MRTLVVSDLPWVHQGEPTCCGAPSCVRPWSRPCSDVDRLVILGDGLELRDGRAPRRADRRRPVLRGGRPRLGPDGECSMLGGNHDHGLVAGWIDAPCCTTGRLPRARAAHRARARARSPPRSPSARARAGCRWPIRACGCARTSTPPRPLRRPPRHGADVPALAAARWRADGADARRYRAPGRLRGGARAAVRVDARAHAALRPRGGERRGGRVGAGLGGDGGRGGGAARVRQATLWARASRVAVAAGDGVRARPGGAGSDRPPGLRSGYLHGIREVVRRLGVGAPHVIWGHSHGAGPWPGDGVPPNGPPTQAAGVQQHRLVGLPGALSHSAAERGRGSRQGTAVLDGGQKAGS